MNPLSYLSILVLSLVLTSCVVDRVYERPNNFESSQIQARIVALTEDSVSVEFTQGDSQTYYELKQYALKETPLKFYHQKRVFRLGNVYYVKEWVKSKRIRRKYINYMPSF